MILKGKKCIATRCLQAVETEANGADARGITGAGPSLGSYEKTSRGDRAVGSGLWVQGERSRKVLET